MPPDDLVATAGPLMGTIGPAFSVTRRRRPGGPSSASLRTGRPETFAVFGYTPEETPEVIEADRAGLARADQLTDRVVGGPYSVFSATEGRALVDGLEAMSPALAG